MTDVALGVVVVVYGLPMADSPAIRSLASCLRPADPVHVVVQDNSENVDDDQEVPAFVDVLVARPDNPGLADAYSTAAEIFSDRGLEWMMLLDQDTVVTRTYLEEVLDATSGRVPVPTDVSVLVPHLRDGLRELSPHRRVRLRTRSLTTRHGVVPGWSTHLNSGSVVRLSAVRRAGGFPATYPLDYLDHAVAARLRQSGGRTWVLSSTLEHRLSLVDRRSLTGPRLASVLDAEYRYSTEFGSRADVGWLAVRLWAGAVLSLTHLRASPDVGAELSAAVRATAAVVSRARGAGRG